jgi:hypothetical protein
MSLLKARNMKSIS